MKKGRGIRSAKLLTKEITPLFNTLNIAANEPFTRKVTVPHCDCHEANEKHFGRSINIKWSRSSNLEEISYHMVPTEAVNGSCKYCGYFAPHMEVSKADQKNKDWRYKCASTTKKLNAGLFKVKGTHVVTGETVEFPSAQHAYQAGYGSVLHALKTDRVIKNWKWERIGGPAKK